MPTTLVVGVVTDAYLRTIAEMSRLSNEKSDRFMKFIQKWSAQKDLGPSYIAEWAERFRKETEYESADDERLKLLIAIDGVAVAKQHVRRDGQKYQWSPEQLDRELNRIDTVVANTVARKTKGSIPTINLKSAVTTKTAVKNIMCMGNRPKLKF